jgi:hypothetical protein
MNVWKMVKNRLAFFGTLPFLRMTQRNRALIGSIDETYKEHR